MSLLDFFRNKKRNNSSEKFDIAFDRLQKAIHDFLEMRDDRKHVKEVLFQKHGNVLSFQKKTVVNRFAK